MKMNKFYNAFVAQHVNSAKAATKNDRNKQMIFDIKNNLAKQSVNEFLKAADVEASTFSRALYMLAKLDSFVAFALDFSDAKLIKNVSEVFRTAMLCAKHNEEMLFSDIECTILLDHNVSDERAHLIYHRASKISADAQVQQSIDLLKSLKIITEVATKRYRVNVNSAAQAMIDRLAIDMTVANDDDSDEVETTDEVVEATA